MHISMDYCKKDMTPMRLSSTNPLICVYNEYLVNDVDTDGPVL